MTRLARQYRAAAPGAASTTTAGLSGDEFRENAFQHFYRMERAAGVPAEIALRNMDEFARKLQAVEGRR